MPEKVQNDAVFDDGGYFEKIASFSRNAKLFLLSHASSQVCLGVGSTILNVYFLKLGFSKSYIGTFMAMKTMAAAISAIPIGVVADRVGRKRSVLWAIFFTILATIGEVTLMNQALLLLASFAQGIGSTFKSVVQNPFLMENSEPHERIHLFSVNQALQTVASVLGSGLAGLMPLIFAFTAERLGWLELVEVTQLRMALAFSIVFLIISAIPMLMVNETNFVPSKRHSVKSDLIAIVKDENLRNLTIYRFMIGAGAGMTIPFFNVFLSDTLNATAGQISYITMGSRVVLTIAVLMSPWLVRVLGRIKSVLVTQLLSIPALLSISFAPSIWITAVLYWFRSALMNMSSPISTSFAMEIVPSDMRATASSTMNMGGSLARSISQMLGGYMMDTMGNASPYYFTSVIYFIATIFYYRAFNKFDKPKAAA
ncbi:MAG: MFS transporter [Firmicutes bacterium]|jgi:MFS family permease|nr:MFS transporter [Bacillota bacterium]